MTFTVRRISAIFVLVVLVLGATLVAPAVARADEAQSPLSGETEPEDLAAAVDGVVDHGTVDDGTASGPDLTGTAPGVDLTGSDPGTERAGADLVDGAAPEAVLDEPGTDAVLDDPVTTGPQAALATPDAEVPQAAAALGIGQGAQALRISRGIEHSLYVDGAGQVWAWGSNARGQLGNGTFVSSTVPVRVDQTGVLAGVRVVQVVAGAEHSMALGADGRVFTWGSSAGGVLGDGGTTNRPSPVVVRGLLDGRRIVQIEAGGLGTNFTGGASADRSFAVGDDGRLFAWGSGTHGALGTGATSGSQLVPALVGGALTSLRVVQVSTSQLTTVALTDDGRIFTWGERRSGSFGNGNQADDTIAVPTALSMTGVIAGSKIVQVSAGKLRTTALSDTGELFTWGAGANGALGTGSMTNALVPVRVDSTLLRARGIVPAQVSSGYDTVGVLGTGGELVAWGRGDNGQFGNGTTTSSALPVGLDPAGVLSGVRIVQYSQRYQGALVLTDDGRLFSWGFGALGNGTTATYSTTPTAVGVPRVTEHPQSLEVLLGAPASFRAAATGTPVGWAVRWQSSTDGASWTDVPGATADTLTIAQATLTDGGMQLRAVYSNAFGETATEPATLTVLAPPVVTVHPPEHVRSLAWLEVSLVAEATGSAPMTVRWETSDDSGATWAVVDGATATTYSFTAASAQDGRLVRAVFVNAHGSATTTHTELEVVRGLAGAQLGVAPSARLVESLTGATS